MAQKRGMGCATVLFLAVVLVAFGAWRLGYVDRLLYVSSLEGNSDASATASLQAAKSGQPDPYVFSTLEQDDRDKYLIVYDALVTREPRTYPETDMDDLSRIRDCVLADHPELFYVTGMRQYTTTNLASGLVTGVTVEGQFSYSEQEAARTANRIEQVAGDCFSSMPAEALTDDYSTAKYFYEYLVEQVVYDHDAARASAGTSQDEGVWAGQTVADALVDGKAVCGEYASAYQYLLQRAGIQCAYVTGQANGGRHAWCVALLDGDYYFIDPTWADPQFMQASGDVAEADDMVNYDYLCVTADDLASSHSASDLYDLPSCTSTSGNYYVREDLLFDWADATRFAALAVERLSAGQALQVRCANEETYRGLLDSFVASGGLSDYLYQNAYHYSYSDQFRSITVFIA